MNCLFLIAILAIFKKTSAFFLVGLQTNRFHIAGKIPKKCNVDLSVEKFHSQVVPCLHRCQCVKMSCAAAKNMYLSNITPC